MADRKLSALVALTAPTIDDELYIIDAGVPKRVRMDALSVSGTWTPSFAGSTIAGAHTYSIRNGIYSRVGRIVYIAAHIELSAEDTGATGNLLITGLPFASTGTYSPSAIAYDQNITMPASSVINGFTDVLTSSIRLFSKVSGGGALVALPVANLSNASIIMISATYQAA